MSSEKVLGVQEYYQNLGEAQLLHRKYLSEPRCYFYRGYMVAFRAIPAEIISAAKIANMKQRFIDYPGIEKVFNDRPVTNTRFRQKAKAEARRLQLVTKEYNLYQNGIFSDDQKALLQYCENKVKELSGALLRKPIAQLETVESVLYSEAGLSKPQDPHRDLPREFSRTAVCAFVCIEEGTSILLTQMTHHEDRESSRIRRFINRFQLSVGDILLFHPRLIHAGDSYVHSNIRLHYYVLPLGSGWKVNETHLLTNKEKSLVCASLNNLRRNLASINECRLKEGESKKSKKRKL